MPPPRLILASRSPRRIELLRDASFAFEVDPADVDESDFPAGLSPAGVAGHLATIKAAAVARRHPHDVVLGADTIVDVAGVIFGKADGPGAARAMLGRLAGARQDVLTGVCVIAPGRGTRTVVERSVVTMRPMSPAELDAYVASDQWRGKAGAYGIQDHDPDNDPFVRLVEGEMTNVVGLPMPRVRQMLADVGVVPEGRSS